MSLCCVPHYFQRAETELMSPFYEWLQHFFPTAVTEWVRKWSDSSLPFYFSLPHSLIYSHTFTRKGAARKRDITLKFIQSLLFISNHLQQVLLLMVPNGIIKSFKRHIVLHFTMEEVDSQSSTAAAMAGLCLPHPNSYVEALPQPPHGVI